MVEATITIDKVINKKPYAKKGDKVIIVAKREDIFIVQHPQTKEKFSVKKEYLNGITTS